ncbi:hypothetical protein E3P99_01952 [Wallemia hederae]|uniref:J domain-containing protein n=1 Tax=Wallemia hederae TaxID=1540922 RepID=A0A4T0FMG5_9BASI|nr:hypothetical protein E3P99_01952 [Wallemia hederae]
MMDAFQVLELPNTASQGEIRKQYLRLARVYHPDKVDASQKAQAEDKFRQISVAYETLTQPDGGNSSSSSSGYNPHYSQAHADPFAMFDQLFAQMTSGFFNDPFFGGGSSRGDPFANDPFFSAAPSRRDPFADMMGGGFFNMGNMGIPAMRSSGGAGRSISTTIVNGRKETRETVTNADGSSTTTITTPEGTHTQTQQATLPQAGAGGGYGQRSSYNALPSAYNRYWM